MKIAPGFGLLAPWHRGHWTRRPYVVEGGCVQPVPDWKSDPYDLLAKNRLEKEIHGRPGLVEDLLQLDPDDDDAIAEFANRWGLLGVFQQQIVEQIYTFTEEGWINPEARAGSALPNVVIESYSSYKRYIEEESDLLWDRTRGDVPASVKVEYFGALEPAEFALGEYYHRYFPQLTKRRCRGALRYPSLHSTQLWDYLCEPIIEFRAAVQRFQSCARQLAAGSNGDDTSWRMAPILSKTDQFLVFDPSPLAGEAHWRLVWLWPSLLSAAYLLLAWNLVDDHSPRFCENERCPVRLFVRTRPDHRFCSISCQNAQRQRRYRTKKESASPIQKEHTG